MTTQLSAICACLGEMYGEPYCYCKMVQKNLPLNETAREAERQRSEVQLKALFGPGGEFYKESTTATQEQSDVQQEP